MSWRSLRNLNINTTSSSTTATTTATTKSLSSDNKKRKTNNYHSLNYFKNNIRTRSLALFSLSSSFATVTATATTRTVAGQSTSSLTTTTRSSSNKAAPRQALPSSSSTTTSLTATITNYSPTIIIRKYLPTTIMKLFQKPNTFFTNFTLFFAATLVAAWSASTTSAPFLLVQATNTDNNNNDGGGGTSVMVDSNGATTSLDTSSTSSSSIQNGNHEATSNKPHKSCPSYGCPLLPRDMYFDKEAQAALQIIRNLNTMNIPKSEEDDEEKKEDDDEEKNHNDDDDKNNDESSTISSDNDSSTTSITEQQQQQQQQQPQDQSLSLFYNEAFITNDRSEDQATLTLIGYKGGALQDQINQDRAFVISPFYVFDNHDKNQNNNDQQEQQHQNEEKNENKMIGPMRLLGVFDGHAKLGEQVSEYSVKQLPQLLSKKLQQILLLSQSSSDSQQQQQTQQEQIQNAINDTFIEVDKTAPAHISGGCTASIVLQIQTQIYIANAGDSRSFIATYDKNTNQTSIVYITREDKPDIPEERIRVENAGGEVYIPSPERVLLGASSRVVYVDKKTGSRNGLAMSRSIGDWAAGELGVIPNPKVDVLDIHTLVEDTVKNATQLFHHQDLTKCQEQQEENGMSSCIERKSTNRDVEVFAVSATDGLLDFLDVNEIAKTVAHSLYVDDSPHPLSACESLITTAASSWWKAKNGRYRDDIAIAVSKLSL